MGETKTAKLKRKPHGRKGPLSKDAHEAVAGAVNPGRKQYANDRGVSEYQQGGHLPPGNSTP
jgi:hypothetical protein